MVFKKLKVLACAASNIAVDNMVERLSKKGNLKICRIGHPARILSYLNKYCLDSLVYNSNNSKIIK